MQRDQAVPVKILGAVLILVIVVIVVSTHFKLSHYPTGNPISP